MFFPFFDRTSVSRDRDCCSVAKISEFQAGANILVGAKVLDIFSMAGRYNKPVQYGRESAHKGEVGDHERSQQQRILPRLTVRRFSTPEPTFLLAPTFC